MNKQFGKYRLLDKIAVGGMAEIWLARQTGVKGFEKLVVLKKILPEFTKNKEFVEMFLDEARVAAMLTHSNIVQIYDLGSVKNIYFIAMEYIFGLSLDQLLIQSVKRKSPLPLQFSCHIISQSATGLHYAHTMKDIYGVSMHIVHRDISPQNILVSFEGIAKVVDFGIAKAKTTGKEKTQVGKIKGKVAYMSPEQVKGEKLDGRSDVFALAIVLYEITTGKRFFPGITNPYEIMDLMLNREFIPPHVLNPKYPKILSKIIMKGLQKDKDKRYKTALAFSTDLDRFLKSFKTPVYSNDLAVWLKATFKDIIQKTKSKHEDLLWEDDDSVEEESTLKSLKPSKFEKVEKIERFKIDEEEEATVFGKPNTPKPFDPPPIKVPPLKKAPPKYEEEEATLFGKAQNYSNQNNPADDEKTMIFSKKPVFDDFDFPEEDDDFENFDKIEEESTLKAKKIRRKRASNSSSSSNIKPVKSVSRKQRREALSYSNKKTKGSKNSRQKQLIEDEEPIKKVKKKKSFLGSLISKLILFTILYSIYFVGSFGLKYFEAEERFSSIMSNSMKQQDKVLNIKNSIKDFCSNNKDVKCVKGSFKVIDSINEVGFSISYDMENKLFFKWPVKINMDYKNKINLR